MMHTGKGRYQLNTFHELGYVLYGPILFTYIVWLIQSTRQDNCRHILFFARDGYFLQPLYQKITGWLGEEALPSTYFLTSRRSVTMASVRTLEDAFALLDMHYQGSCRKFFQVRFGLAADDVPQQEISLPSAHDKSIMMDLIRQHEKEILARAAEERAAYQQYIDGLGIDFTAKTATVDMGYAGTIQYYLAKLIKTDNFTGYYFATSDEHRFLDQPEKLHGCFADREAYGAAGFYVYQYQLLLETILTSPDGQLNYFQSENGQPVPVFGDKSVAQTEFASLGEIHQGIEDFCRDVVNTFGRSLLNMELDTSFLDEWIRSAVLDQGLIADELKSIYMIDDPFCNTTNENVLDIYNKGVS